MKGATCAIDTYCPNQRNFRFTSIFGFSMILREWFLAFSVIFPFVSFFDHLPISLMLNLSQNRLGKPSCCESAPPSKAVILNLASTRTCETGIMLIRSLFSLIGLGLENGGTAGIIWIYFITWIGFSFINVSMAEMGSMYGANATVPVTSSLRCSSLNLLQGSNHWWAVSLGI